ncbi:fam11a b protein [Anaeramoeba ignava]|uniref:Fam11a b protein n=1 Tax=Anaeramoeba ignava TaxID=1746090 RepID=A0A9Q0LSQ4_ANAIG|nr:fam11a b protein [Anaeramoeba ignava]
MKTAYKILNTPFVYHPSKTDRLKTFLFSNFAMAFAFLCIFPLPLLLASLRSSEIIKCSWIVVIIPFSLFIIYIALLGFVEKEVKSVEFPENILLQGYYINSIPFILFLILISLRGDGKIKTNILVLSIPLFLVCVHFVTCYIIWAVLEIKRISSFMFFFNDTIIHASPGFATLCFSVFFILLSLKIDNSVSLSWGSVLSPLFIVHGFYVVLLIVSLILRPFFRNFFSSEAIFSCFIFTFFSLFFLVSDLLVFGKLEGESGLNWGFVFFPPLIITGILGLLGIVLSFR